MAVLWIPDDDATRAALTDWFNRELTHDRFQQTSDDGFAELLLARLRRLSVPDPEA